jgi:hypothetical protein
MKFVREGSERSRAGLERPLPIRIREGQANREKIFQIINEDGPVSVKHIRKRTGLSRPQIYEHINQLVKDKRVYKNKQKKTWPTYVASDLDLGYVTTFAKEIKDALGFMSSPHLLYKHNNNKAKLPKTYLPPSASHMMDMSIYEDVCKRVAGISASKSISTGKITKDNINSMLLFEFANRIGAYITYLFIESMRPVDFNMKEPTQELQLQRRHMLSQQLLQIAINIEQVFRIFHNLLYSMGLTRRQCPPVIKRRLDDYAYPPPPPAATNTATTTTTRRKPLFLELEEENYNKISNAFKKVYPRIYDGLERYWQDTARLWYINQIESKESITGKKGNCNHRWNRVNIFKLEGKYYHCKKCNNVVDGHYYRQLLA